MKKEDLKWLALLQAQSGLGKVLLRQSSKNPFQMCLYGQIIPWEDLFARDGLPILMGMAAYNDFISMDTLLQQEFVIVDHQKKVPLLSGCFLSGNPLPSEWAIPVQTVLNQCSGHEFKNIESALPIWHDFLLGRFGSPNIQRIEVPGATH